jgi:multisubunit Na+/H+ antiporter MnhB subunit
MLNETIPALLLPLLLICAVAFLVLALVFRHHWKEYGYDPDMHKKIRSAYYMGSLSFLFVMALSLVIYLFL